MNRGALIGCYKTPNEEKVIFGCGNGKDQFTYEWNLANNTITQLHECQNQRSAKFYVMPDGTILLAGQSKSIFAYDTSLGLSNIGSGVFAENHNLPISFLNPVQTATCEE